MTGTNGSDVRGKRARGGVAAMATIAVLALSSCGSTTVSDRGGGPTGHSGTGASLATTCEVPTVHVSPRSPLRVQGPAVQNLKGGADRRAWSLDGGDLRVSPPAADQQPVLTRQQAECTAMASVDATGTSLDTLAATSGLAVGYGRVTVATRVAAVTTETVPSSRPAKLPTASAFTNRLAWLVVTRVPDLAFCPLHGKRAIHQKTDSPDWTTVPTTVPGGSVEGASYDYEVWMVDAVTGQDALVYTEGAPPVCSSTGWVAPTRAVPAEFSSIPWRMVSETRSRVTVASDLSPCEGDPTATFETKDVLQVVVEGPVSPDCGPAAPVRITVARGGNERIGEGPIGPVLPPAANDWGGTPASTTTTTTTPKAGLIQLTQADAGRTLRVPVGSVLIAPPLGTVVVRGGVYRSSNPGAVALLTARVAVVEPVTEFRAIAPGTATLSRPTIACGMVGAGRQATCPKPWSVTVVVT